MSQKVLVTAGASGIGLAIARSFRDAGAKVHVADIDVAALERAASDGITGTSADVGRIEDVQAIVRDVARELGGLDVLVNNAGIAGPTAAVQDYPLEYWESVVRVNLNGTFMVTQACIPLLKQSARGAIIIMSSLAGRFGYPNRCAYSTTKWGLVGLAKTLSMELGPSGITCNTIHPGAVDGPRIETVLAQRAQASNTSVEQERERALSNQSVKSFVDSADIAELVRFLAGPHARSISGQSFPIDGDSKSTQ